MALMSFSLRNFSSAPSGRASILNSLLLSTPCKSGWFPNRRHAAMNCCADRSESAVFFSSQAPNSPCGTMPLASLSARPSCSMPTATFSLSVRISAASPSSRASPPMSLLVISSMGNLLARLLSSAFSAIIGGGKSKLTHHLFFPPGAPALPCGRATFFYFLTFPTIIPLPSGNMK